MGERTLSLVASGHNNLQEIGHFQDVNEDKGAT